MKQLVPLLLLLVGCSQTPTFVDGQFASTQSLTVDLSAQLSRDRTVTQPITLDSGVILIPVEENDSISPVVSFHLKEWNGITDEEELLAHISHSLQVKSPTIGDLQVFMPRTIAETFLKQL